MKKLVNKVIAKLKKKASFTIPNDLTPILTNPPKDFKSYVIDKYKFDYTKALIWFLDLIVKENSLVMKTNITKGKWLVKEIEAIKGKEFVKNHITDIKQRENLDLDY